MTIRVLIVDDHRMVREGLRVFLGCDPELVIVGEAADGFGAVEEAWHLRPDVVLMDLHLPGMDGISATKMIRRDAPETKVMILTGMPNSARVFEAMRAGASGFLFKDAEAGEVCSAIRAAVAGQVHLCPQSSASLLALIGVLNAAIAAWYYLRVAVVMSAVHVKPGRTSGTGSSSTTTTLKFVAWVPADAAVVVWMGMRLGMIAQVPSPV